jgi:IMP dehydrogenase/GMP reductase
VFAVKTATGLYRNAGLGLPVSGGMTMVHDAVTGALRMLIADGGCSPSCGLPPPGRLPLTCWPGLARGRRR